MLLFHSVWQYNIILIDLFTKQVDKKIVEPPFYKFKYILNFFFI